MPEAVIWIVSAIGAEAASAALIMYAVEIGTAIYYTALVATAYSYQARQKRKMRDQYNAAQVDRLTNVVTTTGPRELVLGKVRKGGYILFRDSCGTYNDRFVMVVALAAHEIEGVESWYLNDQKVTLDANGYVNEEPYNLTRTETVSLVGNVVPADAIPGTVVVAEQLSMSSDYDTPTYTTYTTYQRYTTSNSKARIRLYTGTSTQTADARLMELFPTVWTSNHRLRGIAYAIVEFVYDETAFPSGLPNLTGVVKGAKVYDPRSGLTAWSENPALHMLHVLQHPYFGKRTSVASTELARVSAAANACDELYTPSGGTAVALYRSSIVLPFGGQASDAFDDLGAAMCGSWAYAGGEFFVKAGKYTAPVIELTEDDLLTSQKDLSGSTTSKSVTINTHRSRADKVNTINVKIYDADADYKETPVTPVKNATAIAKDGRELATDLTLPSVSTASQAKVIANYMLKDSFDSLSITASFKLKAYQIELFDNIYLTIPRYGWTSKVFTVNGKKFDSTGVVELSLRETSAELFNPLVASNSSGYASNTQLVATWDISAPITFTVSSGTSDLLLQADGTVVTRVKVSWPSISDIRLRSGGVVEVQFQELGATSWNSVVVSALETYTYLLGCRDLSTIVVRVRVTTALAVSDWAKQVVHTVLGKTEPPSSVTAASVAVEDQNLVARWSPIPDVDVGGYEIRTTDSGWGSAGFVFQGAGVSTLIPNYAANSVWYIKAYDRSGNYSVTAKSMSFAGYTPISSGITVDLSKQSFVFPASSTGVVSSYVGSGTQIRVYEGSNLLQYDAVGTSAGTWKITTTSTGITVGGITDSGSFATVADHSAMPDANDTASITYTAVGVTSAGVSFSIPKQQTFTKAKTGNTGSIGNKVAYIYLYQWSTSQPLNPNGQSTYTWDSAANSTYTGANGWSVTVPANPGTPLVTLWVASKAVSVAGSTTTSTIDWTSGVSVYQASQNGANGANGANGVKTAEAIVYQWSATAPTITGTSTYVWDTESVYGPPTNWFTTVSDSGTAGQTLWKAAVTLVESVVNTTTQINWSVASISPFGYVGTTGAVGRVAYTKSTTTLGSIPLTYAVAGDSLPSNNSWNSDTAKVATTANLASLSGLLAVDGVTLVAGDRILVKNQTSSVLNGLYTAASGAWSRAPEADTWSELIALKVYVTNGTTNGATWWISDTTPDGVLGTSSVSFTQRVSIAATCATTTALASLSGLLTVDGVTLVSGNRILVKNQVSSAANGVYAAASGAWTRTTDANTWSELVNLNVNVSGGTTNGGTAWLSTVSSGGTLNTTPVTFTPNFTRWSTSVPTVVAGESVWQSDGVYNPTANQTVWEAPYLASLKVGSLSALSTNTGSLTVTGDFKAGNGALSGTTMTGSGAIIYSSGKFAIGNSSNNITYDGTNITLNGQVVSVSNLRSGTTPTITNTNGTFSLGDQTFLIFPTTASFSANGAEKWGLVSFNYGTTGFAHGIAGGSSSPNGFGVVGYSSYDINANNQRSLGALGQSDVAVTGNHYKPSSYGSANNLAQVDTNFSGGHVSYSAIFTSYLAPLGSTTSKFQAFIAPANSTGYEYCAVFGRWTNAGVFSEQVFLATSGYSVFAESGRGKMYAYDGFSPFTGSHHGVHDANNLPEVGDILVDVALLERGNISSTLLKQAISTVPYQKTVIGVFTGTEELNQDSGVGEPIIIVPSTQGEPALTSETANTPIAETYELQNEVFININSLGEGQINVCGEAGNIEAGDLIVTSSIPGKGMRQDNDVIRSCTVAKARESVTFSSATQVKMIACTYLCG